jgi:hypothetical protein
MRITSAPKSASMRTQVGPARARDRSSTRNRERALEALIFGILSFCFSISVNDKIARYVNQFDRIETGSVASFSAKSGY